MTTLLGIDVGGTGIKGAPVDIASGKLLADRFRILTPQPATPAAVSGVVGELARHFEWRGTDGRHLPGGDQARRRPHRRQRRQVVDRHRRGASFGAAIGGPVVVVNDADAAGLAEMEFGAGKGVKGVVMMVTLGTGIGSALFLDGELVPNTELGHLKIGKKDAEKVAAESVREAEQPLVEAVGRAPRRLLRDARRAVLARPRDRGRRGEQEVGEVPAAPHGAHRDRARAAAERGGHRGRGGGRAPRVAPHPRPTERARTASPTRLCVRLTPVGGTMPGGDGPPLRSAPMSGPTAATPQRVGFLGPHGTFAEEALLSQPDLAAGEPVPFRDVRT